jgi:hypothetical protein
VQSELRKALATGRSEDGAAAVQVLHDREVQRLQAEIRKLSSSQSAEQVGERALGKSLGEIRVELMDLLHELRTVTEEGGSATAAAEGEKHLNTAQREVVEEVAAIRDAIDLLGKTKDRIVGGEAPPLWLLRGYRTAVSMSHGCMRAAPRQRVAGMQSSPSRPPAQPRFFAGAGQGRYARVPGVSS